MDAGNIREGDYAGIGVLQSKYGFLAVTKRAGEYALVLQKCGKNQEEKGEWSHYSDCMEPVECEIMKIQSESVELKIICDFRDGKDVAYFTGKVMDSGRSLGNHFLWYIHLNISWDIVLPLHTFQRRRQEGQQILPILNCRL